MGVKRYFMNEKEADAIRKSMYESLLMDENDKIVYWDFDPLRRELREYVDIACGCDEQTYGIRTPQFEYRYCTGKIKMPFAKSDYLANDDIIATVMGLGLDVEKFWFALVFIYDWTISKFHDCLSVKTPLDSLQEICEYIGNGDKLAVSFRMKGRKGKEADLSVKQIIVKSLHDALERERAANPNYVVVLDSDRFTTSYDNILCYQMCFATERFKDLFASLRLPSKVKTRADSSQREVSYNKLLLISRLLYLMRLASNENFKYSDESLKGILKSYKGKIPKTYSAIYL